MSIFPTTSVTAAWPIVGTTVRTVPWRVEPTELYVMALAGSPKKRAQTSGVEAKSQQDGQLVADRRQAKAPQATSLTLGYWHPPVKHCVHGDDFASGIRGGPGQEDICRLDRGSEKFARRPVFRYERRGNCDDLVEFRPFGQQTHSRSTTGADANNAESDCAQIVHIAHKLLLLLSKHSGAATPFKAEDMRLVAQCAPQRHREPVEPRSVAETRDK